MVKGKIHTKRN